MNLYYKLKKTLEEIYFIRLKENEINKTKIGIDNFDFNNKKIKVYLTKNKSIVYADANITIEEQQQLKIKIFEKYGRTTIIKKTIKGFVIPEGFFLTEKGILAETIKKDKDGNEKIEYKLIANRWLFITSRIKSQYHNIFQFEVESIHPTKNKSIIELCNMDTLGKWSPCISFCMNSLAVSTSENYKRELVDYFNKFINENELSISNKVTIPYMGWNNNKTNFFPYSDSLHFDFTGDTSKYMRNTIKSFIPPKNTNLNSYLDKLKFFSQSKDLDFIISTFLAAPLLEITGSRSFTCNFFGTSLSMKSFACYVGMSLFAKPKDIKSTGEDTEKVTMGKIAMFHNLPVYVDEVREGKNPINIYAVGNETDRHRLNQKGQILEKKTWRTIVITTSESSLYKNSNKGGEINRIMCLKVNCSNDLGIKTEEELSEFSRINYSFLESNYALIGKSFINYCIKNKKEILELFSFFKSNIKNEKKINEYRAMIANSCVANYIKNKIFFNIEDKKYSLDLGQYIFNKTEDKKNLDELKNMYDCIYAFYEENQNSFILNGTRPRSNQCYGEVKNEKIYFLLNPLKDYIEKNNFNWNLKKSLQDKGWIEYKNARINRKVQKRIVINESGIPDELENELNEREGIQNDNLVNFPEHK